MEGHCSTGQSPQWAVVPMEEEEEEEEKEKEKKKKKKERKKKKISRYGVINTILDVENICLTKGLTFCCWVICIVL